VHGEQVAITVNGPQQRLAPAGGVEEHLYRLVSEALHNVVKHASADNAVVDIAVRAGVLRVQVRDDGAGFDPEVARAGHTGRSTMAQRATAIGAELSVTSTPGSSTTVLVSVPGMLPE
jgi:signal transduction histidine kinase